MFEYTIYATLALSTYFFALIDASFSEDDGKNMNMAFYLQCSPQLFSFYLFIYLFSPKCASRLAWEKMEVGFEMGCVVEA